MKINYKNKIIEIPDVKKVSFLRKAHGLMFCRREKTNALLFEFKKPTKMRIHSMFVFFPFIAIWLDSENRIVDLKVVKPHTLAVSSEKPFYKLVEVPINEKYHEILRFLDERERFK